MMPLSPRVPLMSPLASRFAYANSLPTTPTYGPSPGLPFSNFSPLHNPITAPGLMGVKHQFSFDPEHIRQYHQRHYHTEIDATTSKDGTGSEGDEINDNRPGTAHSRTSRSSTSDTQKENSTSLENTSTSHIRLAPVPNRKRSR